MCSGNKEWEQRFTGILISRYKSILHYFGMGYFVAPNPTTVRTSCMQLMRIRACELSCATLTIVEWRLCLLDQFIFSDNRKIVTKRYAKVNPLTGLFRTPRG